MNDPAKNMLTLEGWCKAGGAAEPTPIETLHFCVSEDTHLRLEKAEQQLEESDQKEIFVDVDLATLELETSPDCGPLSDARLRVYISSTDGRGNFHLVGHRASDGSLVYSKAVMIETVL